MTLQTSIDGFLAQQTLALAGASRSGRGFGIAVLKDLTGKGYDVLPVHPSAEEIGGIRCYPSLATLPEGVGGLILVVPPEQTEVLVEEAHRCGIERVWMQQGAESADSIRFCQENGIEVVHGECIMMFAEPSGIHRFHRWLWGVLGKLPVREA